MIRFEMNIAPDVTCPDWSVVTSAHVEAALIGLPGKDRMPGGGRGPPAARAAGYMLSPSEALQAGAAIFRPFIRIRGS